MDDLFNKLNNIILNYNEVIIMGHNNPDLDSFGSSLALYKIIDNLGKDCYIFLKNNFLEYNNLMNKAFLKLNNINYINSELLDNLDQTLLIVLDVHQKNRLEDPKILDKINDIVVLDHHIKDSTYIKNTKLTYINSNLSSMIELMTYYLDFNSVQVSEEIATIMLAGLEIDTNNYNLKTTSRTYKASSLLVEMGADISLKQELLKESKEEFIMRADYIRNSYMLNDNTAICILPDKAKRETLAEIADELLTFNNVEQAFAISKVEDNKFGVSARSLNNKDVLRIIKKLDGGGSKTNAATVTQKSIKEIKNIITKYTR